MEPETLSPGTAVQEKPAFTDLARVHGGRNNVLRRILYNQVELRAGWRMLLWLLPLLVFSVGGAVVRLLTTARTPRPGPISQVTMTAKGVVAEDGISFVVLLLLTWMMAKLEKRPLGVYGLPRRGAFGSLFWQGTLWGFGSLTVLLLALRATHNFYFGTIALRGSEIVTYGLLWAFAFLMVGFSEEYTLRGYGLFTTTTGMGFWPAAVLTSILFGAAHLGNPGEAKLGILMVVVDGLFMCFILRRTGNLWFCVGIHAAWDWGQSYFYGTPDSGLLAKGHLFNSHIAGSDRLSGGTVGPEGSILIVPLYALLFLVFHLTYKQRDLYPDPTAIKHVPSAPPAIENPLSAGASAVQSTAM